MPQYAILRFSKQKGGFGALESHHERKKDNYASNPDIDTSHSNRNFHIVQPVTSYKRESDGRIKTAGCKTRKDSVRFVDTLITASPEFFKGKKRDEVRAYFERALKFLSRKVGEANIFTAVVHMDEKTPHMHLCFTPITEDVRLSAKEIIGNRAQLVQGQDQFHACMVKKYPNLERGEPAIETRRRHIPTRIFKEAVHLTKQAARIQEAISSINPFNIGKKQEEIGSMMYKFFPRMEDFETQVRKYEREFERQEKENAVLAKKAETKMSDQMETASLRGEVRELRRIVASIPDEYKQQFQHTKNQQPQEVSL